MPTLTVDTHVTAAPPGTALAPPGNRPHPTAVLEDADAGERASVLAAMPALPRLIWHTAGQRIYARRMRRLRGRP